MTALRNWNRYTEDAELLCKILLKECFTHMMEIRDSVIMNDLIFVLFEELEDGGE